MISPVNEKILPTNQLEENNELNLNQHNFSKFAKIKEFFVKWSLESTYHCYPKIFKETRIIAKIFWLSIFLALSSSTIWIVVKCLLDYYNYTVVSTIRTIKQVPIQFPTVTICDANPFTTQRAQQFLNEIILQKFNKDIGNETFEDSFWKIYDATEIAKINAFNFDQQNKTVFGFNLNEIFSFCLFNGELCDLKKDFSWYYSYEHGNCFQFNSGKNYSKHTLPVKFVSQSGIFGGFSIFLGPFINDNKYASSYSKGLKIFIHNQLFNPSGSQVINIETGKEVNLAIKETHFNSYPAPYSECIDLTLFKSKFYKMIINSKKAYRQIDCFELCFQQNIIDECKCYFLGYPVIDETIPCINYTNFECIYSQFKNYTSYTNKNCVKDCPLECDSVVYDYYLSSLVFPNEQTYNMFISDNVFYNFIKNVYNKTPTYNLFRESFVGLNIFYPSLEYTEIKETPKTTSIDLISSIGHLCGI